MIPPMLMHPLVENAIWHSLMQTEGEGTITIEIKSKSATHKSHGLKATSQWIEMMNKLNSTGAQVHIIDLKDEQGNALVIRVELIIPL